MATFEAERRPPRPRDARGAGASAAVRREHSDVVGQAQHLVAQCRVRVAREPLLELGAKEIDARDVSDEQRAPAEEVLRIFGAAQVADEEGHVLGRVPRRRDAAHAQRADIETLSVMQRCVRVLDPRVGPRHDRDRSQLGERARSRQVVVVDVCLE